MTSATSCGSATRFSAESAAQFAKISSWLLPCDDDRAFASSFNRSVAVYPGPTLLTRMPSFPNSLDRVLTSRRTAARTAFESTRSGSVGLRRARYDCSPRQRMPLRWLSCYPDLSHQRLQPLLLRLFPEAVIYKTQCTYALRQRSCS